MEIMAREPDTAPVLIAKRQHKKSRNGCAQCKLRKVKCDERRPLCKNCARHYKDIERCDFLSTQSKPHIVPARPDFTIKRNKAKGVMQRPNIAALYVGDVGAGVDPFDSYPQCKVPNSQLLMHHYFQHFNTKTYPVHLDHQEHPIMQSVWQLASDDPVLFHATLQLSALDLELLRGGDREAQSKFLLNKECITLLRERVEDPVLGLSDQTIASVLFLIIVEFERGNFKMVEIHVNGLKRMVKLRGGIEQVRESNYMLANLIFGITLSVTTELQFIPATTFTPLPDTTIEPNLDPRLFSFDACGLAKGHAQILRYLRYMTNQADLTWPHNAAPTGCSEILSRVLSLPVPAEEGPLVASISESMRLATVGLCFLPWRNNYPSPELMLNTMMLKLRVALGPLLALTPSSHTLLPFLLSVGALITEPPERNWFIGHLVPVVTDMNIRSWQDMKPHLTKVLWMEYFCEAPFRELWEVVEEKRKDLDVVDLDVW